MNTLFKRALAAFALLLSAAAQAQVELTNIEAGNVTPTGFSLVWRSSAPAAPGLRVFADPAGAVEVTDQVRVEFFPLALGDRLVASDYEGRIERRDLQTAIKNRGLALARVSGLYPNTDYYARALALDESGDVASSSELPLVAVKTATENRFVEESKQLVLDFASEPAESVQGAIARLESPDMAYPLFAVVGDGSRSTEAFFNLDHLLDARGKTNASPSGAVGLRMRLLGSDTVAGSMDYSVVYGGGFVAAGAAVVAFEPGAILDSFAFETIGDQVVGAPFTVTIRALDVGGEILASFDGAVELTSALALSSGGGATGAFENGVLQLHSVTIAQAGQATLVAREIGGDVTGESNVFQVEGLTIYRQLALASSPPLAGTVYGAGEYIDGQTAQIRAVPRVQYRFDRWEGAGAADPAAADTTVAMTGDRALTAVFVEKPQPSENSYEAWKMDLFAEVSDPTRAGPADDYDGDGLSNLLEYAFGGDPLSSDRADAYPRGAVDESGYPVFSYVRRVTPGDLTYTVQFSADLSVDFETYSPPASSVTIVSIGAGLELVSFPIPVNGAAAFVRVMVQLSGE